VLPQQHTRAARCSLGPDRQPIYQQLADLLAAQLLEGDPPEGEAMPSVRVLATRQHLLNPLTVNRALAGAGRRRLGGNRRGLGLFVRAGARERLREGRARSLPEHRMAAPARTPAPLGLGPEQLIWEERA
jgi:GntR family transcriptional regulator